MRVRFVTNGEEFAQRDLPAVPQAADRVFLQDPANGGLVWIVLGVDWNLAGAEPEAVVTVREVKPKIDRGQGDLIR